MGIGCPLQSAQPFGANTKLMILISERNGSAMWVRSVEVQRGAFRDSESEDTGVKEVKQGLVGVLFYSAAQIPVQLFFVEKSHTEVTKEHKPRMNTNGREFNLG
jgi:hypothetical protein